MSTTLYTGRLVRLAAAEPKQDAEVIARWSHDSEYLRLLDSDAARGWSMKNAREAIERHAGRSDGLSFMIRTLADNRLIGFVGLDGIRWTHGDAFVGIGIGERDYWGKGYGTDAMRAIARYAFTELNLHRLTLEFFEYNTRAQRCYEKVGFTVEGRVRQAMRRDGRRWDLIFMGLLRSEWEKEQDDTQA